MLCGAEVVSNPTVSVTIRHMKRVGTCIGTRNRRGCRWTHVVGQVIRRTRIQHIKVIGRPRSQTRYHEWITGGLNHRTRTRGKAGSAIFDKGGTPRSRIPRYLDRGRTCHHCGQGRWIDTGLCVVDHNIVNGHVDLVLVAPVAVSKPTHLYTISCIGYKRNGRFGPRGILCTLLGTGSCPEITPCAAIDTDLYLHFLDLIAKHVIEEGQFWIAEGIQFDDGRNQPGGRNAIGRFGMQVFACARRMIA